VICLQLLESFYQVLALALLGGVYGLFLLVRHRRALLALLPKLGAVAAASLAATWLVFGPYLAARAQWGVLQAGPARCSSIPRIICRAAPRPPACSGWCSRRSASPIARAGRAASPARIHG